MLKRTEPTLKNYIHRVRLWRKLIEKHPEREGLLKRKIKETEKIIVEYVTSDSFAQRIEHINL